MNSDDGDLFDEELENAFGVGSQSQIAFSQQHANHQNRLVTMDDDDEEVQLVEELEFRQGLARVHQSQQALSSKRSTIDPIRGEPVAATTQLDKVLFNFGVERRINENNKEFYAIRGADMTYEKLVKAIDKKFENDPTQVDDFMAMLRSAVSVRDQFKLFVLPTVSYAGEQDTLFRALITAKTTQIAAFKLLVEKFSGFADEEATTKSVSAKEMALACLSHMRALRYLHDGRELFDTVFDCPIEKWTGVLRREFLLLIPDCFPDLGVQQDCLLNLTDMLIKGFETDSLDTRKAIVEDMRLLSAGAHLRQRLRCRLLEAALSMEAEIVFDIFSLCVDWARVDDSKGMIRILCQIREHVRLEELFQRCANRDEYEQCFELAANCLSKMANSIYISGSKAVKSTIKFLQMNDEGAVGTQQDEDEIGEKVQKKFVMFDTLLCFAMLNAPNIDEGIMVPLKTEIVHQPSFVGSLSSLAADSKFHQKFSSSIMYVAKHLIPNNVPSVSEVGAILYKNLFIHHDAEKAVSQMISHISVSDAESTAVINVLCELADGDGHSLIPLLSDLISIIDHFCCLSTSNVRRVFEVLLKVSIVKEKSCDYKNEVTPLLEQYLSAINPKEKLWGVLGLLVHLDIYLSNTIEMSESEREKGIFDRLKIAQSRTDQSPSMKAEFYRNFAAGLRANRNMSKSKYILEWTDILMKTFQKQFIKDHSDADIPESSNPNHRIHISGLLKSGKAVELIPYVELLNELCACQERWLDCPTGSVHLQKMICLLDIELYFDDVKGEDIECTEYCDSLFLAIEFLRLSLNVFASSARGEEINNKIQNRIGLMLKYQEELVRNVKKLGHYRIPNVTWSIEREDLAVMVTHKTTVAKPRGRKRKQPDGDREENGPVGSSERLPSETTTPRTPGRSVGSLNKDPSAKNVQADCMIVQYVRPLNLKAIIDLIELLPSRKEWIFFLLTEFRRNFNLQMPNKSKSVPWETNKITVPGEQFETNPDSRTLWKLLHRLLKTFFVIMHGSQDQFERFRDESNADSDNQEATGNTFLLCLEILRDALAKKDVSLRGSQKNIEDCERRRDQLLSKVVAVIDNVEEVSIGSQTSEGRYQSDESRIVGYLLKRPAINHVESACTLLEIFDLLLDPKCANSDIEQIVTFAWQCMVNDWAGSNTDELKKAAFQKRLGFILERYLMFRKDSQRLHTMCVFVAKVLVSVIPDSEKDNYKMPDNIAETLEYAASLNEAHCVNLTRSTFPTFFKVLFQVLNHTASSKYMKSLKEADRLSQWEYAARCFRALSLFIRVKSLRSMTVLSTALREGRRFLSIFCQPSNSFLRMFERPITDGTFLEDVQLVLKDVQVGNRALQCVGVDAKEKKTVSLCTLVPELRAAYEMLVRQMRSAFECAGCAEAFSIGILKSRNMDGNEIVREARPPSRARRSEDPDPVPEESCPFNSDEDM